MEMSGEYRISAPRERVWAALNDPELLKASIPGCESLDMLSPTEMTAKVVAKIGPVKATFNGKVHLLDLNPPESYTISGEGQGGVAGFAKGGADVKLTVDGDGTLLTYSAKAQIGGKLAQLGARLIDSTAKMMADQFFGRFSELVAAAEPHPAASAEPTSSIEPAPAPLQSQPTVAEAFGAGASIEAAQQAAASKKSALNPSPTIGSVPRWVWILAVAILVVVILKMVF